MDNKKLYLGNLNYSATSDDVTDLCAEYGNVADVKIIEGKGFGFVEFETSESAMAAKEGLDGVDFKGRPLKVDEARPRKEFNQRDNYNNRDNGYGRDRRY